MKWDTPPEQFFSDEFLDQLSIEFKIEEQLRQELRKQLERAASNWYFQRTSPINEVSLGVVKKSLLDIQEKATALKESLLNSPEAIWPELAEICVWTNSSEYSPRFEYHDYPYPEAGFHRKVFISYLAASPEYQPQSVEVDIFLAALNLLAEKAAYPPTVKQGPQPDQPLQRWVVDMRNIWLRPLDRPFTVQEDKGQPRSEAAHFCVKVYAHLAPETPQTRVMHEMKKQIAEEKATPFKFSQWKK